ncbi:kelch-like protein 21 isoform X1 [Petromyzon marinus]|uniref:kelch-like protein 21 isoform X1 n=2 Tax=Petromyzon marinus TaxID=7757 RepID=UPI003F71DA49
MFLRGARRSGGKRARMEEDEIRAGDFVIIGSDEDETLCQHDTAYAGALLAGLAELRAQGKLCDVALRADGLTYPCHRAVLAAASPYFRAMFAGGPLRESREQTVQLQEVSAGSLSLLLDFAYTGRVCVTGDNAEPLLRAADLLQFPAVKEACCRYLARHLDPANCLDMQAFAEAFACPSLVEDARVFALGHIAEIGASEDFERLPAKRLSELLGDDRLSVDKEEAAYQLALRWVHADPQNRQRFWPELFERVRLPFVRRFFLLAHVESEPLVHRSPRCLRLLREARVLQGALQDRHDRLCPLRFHPRPSTGLAEILVAVGGCDQDCEELVSVDCHNPVTGQWRYLAALPERVGGGYSIAALGNDIYVTGGSDGTTVFSSVWRYNSGVNEWSEAPEMSRAREYHASAALAGCLYVVAPDGCECFDPAEGRWRPMRPLPQPLENVSATACRGRVYTVGSPRLAGGGVGWGAGGVITDVVVHCYEPDTDSWAEIECADGMPGWSYVLDVVALDGIIYFIREDSTQVDALDPIKSRWIRIPPMNQVHVGGSVAPLGGRLYVSGGYDDSFELSDMVECYDPAAGRWEVVGRLPQPTFWHGSVSIFRQFMPPGATTAVTTTAAAQQHPPPQLHARHARHANNHNHNNNNNNHQHRQHMDVLLDEHMVH